MKKLLFIFLCLPFIGFTQTVPQGINYQAVARDANGDVLMNQNLTIQFSVISDITTSAVSWQETHTVTTNDYGLYTAIIGQGTATSVGSSASFDVIDWGASNHLLKVEVDYGGGLIDMGTTAFMSVPYSLYSANPGPQGVAGLDGTNGTTGAAGSDGADGTNGTNGAVGAQGLQGIAGSDGANGNHGTNGTNGADGAVGAQGIQGVVGTTGNTGSQGTTGNTGAAGTDGTNGIDGTNGVDGAVGAVGAQGIQGVVGTIGNTGSQGTTGNTGSQGTTGNTGAQGATGQQGIQGIAGTNGVDSAMVASMIAAAVTNNPTQPAQIGEYREGGIVFWIDYSGQHGLVCDLQDLPQAQWGCFGNAIPGADGQVYGAGIQNTIDILASCYDIGIAAALCASSTAQGYNDWFLPSKYALENLFLERNNIYFSLIMNGGSFFSQQIYLSSTENDHVNAWAKDFDLSNAMTYPIPKSTYLNVRAVRAF